MTLSVLTDPLAAIGFFAIGWFLCSRTQANRLHAASEMIRTADGAATQVLAAAKELANISGHLDRVSAELGQNNLRLVKLGDLIESLDRNQGSILNVLVNSGLIGALGGEAQRETQVGETVLTRRRAPGPRPADDIPIPPPREHASDAAR